MNGFIYNRTLHRLIMCLFGKHQYYMYHHRANCDRKMCRCCLKQKQRVVGFKNEGQWIVTRTSKIFTDIRL